MQRSRVALSTGVSLDVVVEGAEDAPPIVFLHGFPESADTWRHQIADLKADFRIIAPDQRGFAGSEKPQSIKDYRIGRLVADVLALADHFGLQRFTLVAHDWGGAVAWAFALKHSERLERLVIANAPHPWIFQKSLFVNDAQRAASQYIRDLRRPGKARQITARGIAAFFDQDFAPHVKPGRLSSADRDRYLDEWSQPRAFEAMLNWYKASQIVVPAPDERSTPPDWLAEPFPQIRVPTLVIWGLNDHALLPVQLDGLDDLVPGVRIVTLDAGHFVPWEAPTPVTAAIRSFPLHHRLVRMR